LQHVAALLPLTHAASGMRAALLSGASSAALRSDVSALALFALVGFPMSMLMFGAAVDHAKRTGSLDHR
jgi:hypothetical protein